MMKFYIRMAIIFLIVLCSQADAEILIYKTTISGYEYNGVSGEWEGIERKDRGYLVLDIEYVEDEENERINVVNAIEIKYWKDEDDYLYDEINRDYHITRVEYKGNILWFLAGSYADAIEVQALITKGQTKETMVDFNQEVTKEVASQLTGNNLSDIQLGTGHYVDTWSTTFRLHSQWTKVANDAGYGNGDFDYAVDEIIKNYLIKRGYEET